VISGETGCGKTTQVPQFILDDQIERGKGSACRIVCTQPRRISAISVAERVAVERAESCGNGNSTGYQIRLQSRFPRKQGSVLYATTGIVLQWLQTDRLLRGTSHLVLDEVHERSLQSDFLLTIVRDVLPHRPDLSIIVMSATLNAQMFSRYFGGCPIIHIPGFTFPVQEYLLEDVLEMTRYPCHSRPQQRSRRNLFMHGRQRRQAEQEMQQEYEQRWPEYLDSLHGKYSMSTVQALEMIDDELIDADLIAALIRHIVLHAEDGAILVFLPGWADISKLHTTLTADQMFSAEHFIIIPLHSLMPTISQTKVFERPPPGVRKIVIATNIAETSITIDDVVHVIDCGKIKETHFDVDNNISTMKPEWVSLANAKQRRGRAGGVVQAGFCYHLYNGLRANMLSDYQLPEMLRTPLEELCLQIKILKLGRIEDFIKRTMQPPTEQAVLLAITNLIGLNALSRAEELTALGFHLARLPVEPHIGKLILFGAMFSCLDPVLGIAACLGFKDPFVIPLGKEKLADAKRRELSQNCKSDHLTIVYALQRWEQGRRGHGRSVNDFCWEYFLSQNTLQV
uniref:RNA helicase n=1 Tax=Petromyzon marinus TaxID=7757 RepID=S4RGX7_PETMA